MDKMEPRARRPYGIDELSDAYGMDINEMCMQSLTDGVSPAICTVCGYTTEMEPDQDRGWCEECNKNTVKSCLVLVGAI